MGNVHSFSVTMLKYRSVLQVLQWNFGVFRWFFMAEDLQRASRTADIIAVLRLPVKINAILCLGMRSFKGMFYCCWLGFTTLCMTVNRIISLWTPMPHRLVTRLWLYFPLRDLAVFACLQDWFLFPWIVACCLDEFLHATWVSCIWVFPRISYLRFQILFPLLSSHVHHYAL